MNTMLLQFIMLVKSYVPTTEREEGQGMVEYALIIALVAVLLVGGLGLLKDEIAATFTTIIGAFTP